VQQVRRGLRAEAAQSLEPVLPDGRLELGDRRDAQLLIELHRLARPQTGNHGHRADAGRDLCPQLLDGGNPPGTQVLDDLVSDRRPDARDLLQSLGVQAADVVVVAGHRAGRLLVHPGPERVPADNGEQVRVLLEQRRDVVVRPCHRISLCPRFQRGS
jgi:hypothetical protein